MASKKDCRHKIIGGKHRALSRYYSILHRLENTDKPKNAKYKGVKLLVSKEDFVKWFMENDFEGASVDRIDSHGDYSLDNMQLIPLCENIAKDKRKSMDGFCSCFACGEVKPLEQFAVDKRRQNGHSTICKKCDSKRKWVNNRKDVIA